MPRIIEPKRYIELLLSRIERRDELDFTEASLHVVEELLDEASKVLSTLSDDDQRLVVEGFAWYILEVGRRALGGRYCWHDGENAPVLVVGEPACRVSLLATIHVRGRLLGDEADYIPFFYEGFAERARAAVPDDDVIFI